jgi:hypothetical protein
MGKDWIVTAQPGLTQDHVVPHWGNDERLDLPVSHDLDIENDVTRAAGDYGFIEAD